MGLILSRAASLKYHALTICYLLILRVGRYNIYGGNLERYYVNDEINYEKPEKHVAGKLKHTGYIKIYTNSSNFKSVCP